MLQSRILHCKNLDRIIFKGLATSGWETKHYDKIVVRFISSTEKSCIVSYDCVKIFCEY